MGAAGDPAVSTVRLSRKPGRCSGAREFDTLLERASRVLELPGDEPGDVEAYVMAGRATVAHCDLLIAVWDGKPARGRGGTAEVVEMAIARGRPVIHIPPEPDEPAKLLWAAFDPVVDTSGADPMSERPFDEDHVDRMLTAVLLPPPGSRNTASSRDSSRSGCHDSGRASNIACFSPRRGFGGSACPTSPRRRALSGSSRNGASSAKSASTQTISPPRSTCSKRRTAGLTGSRRTSPSPIEAATSSAS